ncbi:exodeoxyribonuclease VII small subunit [Parablautia muri]|uniref:Exodeoxyribonuclease 7 small subunit n=1 Tax=Parablautia muri TaxID=2320879 RepID=A0A9X5BDE1_9FIRM|nr:exodeoxyribonuclease VII small subunit [Parablautia muri]NBJ91685.1 exodeoxyribonuclease VII small subunit [Parablautia muri]
MPEQDEKELKLEEAFEKLEEAVLTLEQEDISLEESFQIYKSGMELLKKCNQAIDQVEKKVLVLNEDGKTYEF